MKNMPPSNSRIQITSDNGRNGFILPYEDKTIGTKMVGFFMLIWLCLWAVGIFVASFALTKGFDAKGSSFASPFLLIWLVGWTLGGLFALRTCYRCFQSSVPQTLIKQINKITYDNGIPTFKAEFGGRMSKDTWRNLFPKRRTIDFSLDELKTMRVREHEKGNRLTIDQGAERIEIGAGLGDIEREWLDQHLAETYKLNRN